MVGPFGSEQIANTFYMDFLMFTNNINTKVISCEAVDYEKLID